MTEDLSLLDEIEQWHSDDKHFKIIDAILEVPKSDRDYELTCLLARAYNNMEEYEKALELLLSVEGEGKYDLTWHFRIGFSYYYLDALELAEKAFERVLKSDPEDPDANEFLKWIREEIAAATEIKPEQEKVAMEHMIDWLSHENELGYVPAEIEAAGEFDLHGFHYYIFKYKKTSDESWLLGVAGGYGRCDLEHCGHVFSEMEEYHPETAEEKAIELIEMMRETWMNKARKEMEARGINPDDRSKDEPRTGPFAGFVLLNSFDFDMEKIKENLKNDWDIIVRENLDETDSTEVSDGKSLVFDSDDMRVVISFIETPVPNGEAEHYAETNYMWPDAADITKTHTAQILLAVIDRGQPAIKAGELFTKVAASCLKLENAVAIYTSGTVFPTEFYVEIADIMNEGDLPILNWIYFGVYTSDKGTSGYTYGLRMFGKEEIEIIDSTAMPESVHEFLIDIAYYVLSDDITFKDGETIGFTEFQKLRITKSKGIALDGYTLKIEY